jgi:hypothetical protein
MSHHYGGSSPSRPIVTFDGGGHCQVSVFVCKALDGQRAGTTGIDEIPTRGIVTQDAQLPICIVRSPASSNDKDRGEIVSITTGGRSVQGAAMMMYPDRWPVACGSATDCGILRME